MVRSRSKAVSTALSAIVLTFAAPAFAQGDADRPENTAQITVYGWLAGYGGDIRPGPGAPSLSVDKSFGELFRDIDAAFFASGFVRRDRIVFLADISHTSSSKEGLVPTGLPAPAPPFVPAEGGLRQTSLTAAAGYRVADTGRATLDLLGGVRTWWVRPRVQVPALGVERRAEVDFVDPVIAARAGFALSPRLSALAYADIGGFGAGSDITAQGVATLNVRVSRQLWLSGGYRYLLVDYEKNGVRVDSRLGGPLVGVTLAL
jgi:hypothetical protein